MSLYQSHPEFDTLERHLMGCLPEPENSEVEEHLLGCEPCQDRAEALDRQIAAIRMALGHDAI